MFSKRTKTGLKGVYLPFRKPFIPDWDNRASNPNFYSCTRVPSIDWKQCGNLVSNDLLMVITNPRALCFTLSHQFIEAAWSASVCFQRPLNCPEMWVMVCQVSFTLFTNQQRCPRAFSPGHPGKNNTHNKNLGFNLILLFQFGNIAKTRPFPHLMI